MIEIDVSPAATAELPALAEHQPAEFVCSAAPGARLVLRIDGIVLEPFLRPGEATWRWRWNPGTAVGLHRVELAIDESSGTARRDLALRVMARKIDQARYEALINDLQRVAYRLVVALGGASAEGAALERGAPWNLSPTEEYYALLEDRLGVFARAVRRIAAQPREQLRDVATREPLGTAAEISAAALAGLARGEFDPAPPEVAAELQAALRPGGGVLPREVAGRAGQPSADTYEHRLLKHLLALLARRARFVGTLATREAARLAASAPAADLAMARRARAEQIVAGCAEASATLRELQALPFLAEVHALLAFRGATPLLQRDAHYREVYRMWQALRQQPQFAFDSPLFATPIADLPRLYESWCAIQVAEALLTLGGELRAQHLIEVRQPRDDALEHVVALSERAPLLEVTRGEWTITLRYQPRYRPARGEARAEDAAEAGGARRQAPGAAGLGSLDRYTHVPDLAIELRAAGQPPQAIILDAKYRVEADGQRVPQDALADAYTYLGAIGREGRRASLTALLLYPGAGLPEEYSSGVGAIPLLPGHTAHLAAAIGRWLPG